MSIEIIVVCDADESCFSVASGYSSQGVIVCNLVKHRGSYVAQNTGVSISSGDYITFCGADDIMAAGRIRRMFSLMRRHGPMSLVNSFFSFVDSEGVHIKDGDGCLGGIFMYSREMFDRLGGFRDWECAADTDFVNRAVLSGGTIRAVRGYDYKYRRHGKQLTLSDETGSGSSLRDGYLKVVAETVSPEWVSPKTEDYYLESRSSF